MADSVSGRVSPEDLEAMDAALGCGATQGFVAHVAAAPHVDGCKDCARLLFLAIARRVESATIERATDAVLAWGKKQAPHYTPGVYAALRALDGLPCLYAEAK